MNSNIFKPGHNGRLLCPWCWSEHEHGQKKPGITTCLPCVKCEEMLKDVSADEVFETLTRRLSSAMGRGPRTESDSERAVFLNPKEWI